MSKRDEMRLQLSLQKCRTAKMELELGIIEKEEEIQAKKDHIILQEEREKALLEELEELKKK